MPSHEGEIHLRWAEYARRGGRPTGAHWESFLRDSGLSPEDAQLVWKERVDSIPVPKAQPPRAHAPNPQRTPLALVRDEEITPLQEIDWPEFWATDHSNREFLVEPIIPVGREVRFVAEGKSGKSLLMLDICAALATGGPLLGRSNPHGPIDVYYADAEMTEADLEERLAELGYGSTDDLGRLHYTLLPNMEPGGLDAENRAAKQFVQSVLESGAELVVIDTLSRVVAGKENESETWTNLNRLVAVPLKRAGVTIVGLDHLGKDATKGARGSSAKGQTIDVEYTLTQTRGTGGRPDVLVLKLPKNGARLSWVPERVEIHRTTEPHSGSLSHIYMPGQGAVAVRSFTDEQKALAAEMDKLGIDRSIGRRQASEILRNHHGIQVRNEVLAGALRWRKGAGDTFGDTSPAVVPGDTSGDTLGHIAKEPVTTGRDTFGDTLGHIEAAQDGDTSSPIKGDVSRGPTLGEGVGVSAESSGGTPEEATENGGNHIGNHFSEAPTGTISGTTPPPIPKGTRRDGTGTGSRNHSEPPKSTSREPGSPPTGEPVPVAGSGRGSGSPGQSSSERQGGGAEKARTLPSGEVVWPDHESYDQATEELP